VGRSRRIADEKYEFLPALTVDQDHARGLLRAAWRELPRTAGSELLRRACHSSTFKTAMHRMNLKAVPPKLGQALRTPQGWRVAVELGRHLHRTVARDERFNRYAASLVGMWALADEIERQFDSQHVATLWLTWVYGGFPGDPLLLPTQMLLRSSRWQLEQVARTPAPFGCDQGQLAQDLASGTLTHPGAQLPAAELAALLLLDARDEHDTVAWVTGTPGTGEKPDLDGAQRLYPMQEEELLRVAAGDEPLPSLDRILEKVGDIVDGVSSDEHSSDDGLIDGAENLEDKPLDDELLPSEDDEDNVDGRLGPDSVAPVEGLVDGLVSAAATEEDADEDPRRGLQAAYDALARELQTAQAAMRVRRLPGVELLTAYARLHQRVAETIGSSALDVENVTLDELLDRLAPSDPKEVLLDRLERCGTSETPISNTLQAGLTTLRELCAAIRTDLARTGPDGQPLRNALVKLAELLDSDQTPSADAVMQLLPALPQQLNVVAFAASHGKLTLGSPLVGAAPTAATTGIDRQPANDNVAADDETPRDVDADDGAAPAADPPATSADSDPQPGEDTADNTDVPDPDGDDTAAVEVIDDLEEDSRPSGGASSDEERDDEPVAGPSAPSEATEGQGDEDQDDVEPDQQADEELVEQPDTELELPDHDDVEELLAATLQHGDVAAAHWIAAEYDEEPGRATAFKLLALAPHTRRDSGPTTSELTQSAARVPDGQLAADGPTRAVSVAAVVRAGFAAPWAMQTLLDRAVDELGTTPAIRHLLEAARDAARAGVRLGASVAGDAGVDIDAEAARLARQAAQLLEEGPGRTSGYHAATRVWQLWIDPDHDDGWLARLLVIVAGDKRRQLRHVKQQRAETETDRQLVALMNETDKRDRGNEHRDIEYHGRDSLLRRTKTCLAVIDDWAELIDTAQQAEAFSHEEQAAATLHRAINEYEQAALDELRQVGEGALAAAATALACTALADTLKELRTGRAPSGREPQPAALLVRPLLRTDVTIDRSSLRPAGPVRFEQLAVLAASSGWYEAFQRRISRGDYDEAALIVEVMDQVGDDDARLAADELDVHVIDAQAEARHRWLEVRGLVDRAKRHGLLDADDALLYDITLDELDLTGAADEEQVRTDAAPSAAADGDPASVRTDVGGVLRQLDELDRQLADATAAMRHRELERLAAAAADNPSVEQRRDEIAKLIDEARFAQADEILIQIQQGADMTGTDQPAWFRPELLRTVAEPGDADELRQAIVDKGTCAGLNFAEVEDPAASAELLAVPERVLKSAATETTSALRSLLLRLGMEIPATALSAQPPRGGRHRFVGVSDVQALGAPIYQFGSTMDERIRVLVTPVSTLIDQIVELIEEDTDPRGVLLLLHAGTFTLAQRRELEAKLREVSPSVLPYDLHLLAARLSVPDVSWASTVGLAAPFSGLNPFMWNKPGNSLPKEAFFGRRRELKALLDPFGGTTVFGGRQLGKTALLKQASERFTRPGEHRRAVLRSIKDTGIDNDASAVWTDIRGMLGEAQIPTQRSDEATSADTIIADVAQWLNEDDDRRLLLLLDEADHFLKADGPHYSQLERIKQLTEDQRVRVVLAGLNDVTRFQRDANHPFVHLGQPLGIGGLAPEDALALLRTPLQAVGVSVTDHVLLGAVTYANYHPAILQRFGYELVTRVAADQPRAALRELAADDVDKVFDDSGLRDYVSQLLGNTLRLDARYGVVACALALADLEAAHDALPQPRSLSDVQTVLKDKGARRLFAAEHRYEVAGLLDELALLGIVRRRGNDRYELRSRYIARMLGDEPTLQSQLAAFATASDGATYDASRDRRPLPGELRRQVPPLADRDLNEMLTGPASSVRAIVGVDAAHLDHVLESVRVVADTRFAQRRFHKLDLSRRGGRGKPPHASKDVHRVVLSDLQRTPQPGCERAIAQAQVWEQDPSLPGSVGVGLVLGPTNLGLLRQLVGDDTSRLQLTSLKRLDHNAIRLWADLAEVEPLDEAEAVALWTGGWPSLLTRAAATVAEQGCALDEAAEQISHRLHEDARAAAEFVQACGFDQFDHPMRTLLDTLGQYGPVTADELERETASRLAPHRPLELVLPGVRTDRRLAQLLGLVDLHDDRLQLEAVLASARAAAGTA